MFHSFDTWTHRWPELSVEDVGAAGGEVVTSELRRAFLESTGANASAVAWTDCQSSLLVRWVSAGVRENRGAVRAHPVSWARIYLSFAVWNGA